MPAVHTAIGSAANPLLKAVRKAVRRGSATDDGLAVVESPKLVAEALASLCAVERILIAERALDRLPESNVPTAVVADKLFDALASTQNSQGVLALVRLPAYAPAEVFRRPGPALILDRISDPGNAGAIVRSAEAFGAAGAVFVQSASPENPKTIRAAAGSLFRLPFAVAAAGDVLSGCGRRLLAASAHGGAPLVEADLENAAVVVGSEAHGVSEEFLALAERVVIPTEGVESLNAAAAATVLLYEAARRRRAIEALR